MKCRILSEIDGRMRVRLCTPRMTLKQADIVEEYLSGVPGAKKVNVYDRNCNVVIEYADRAAVVSALARFSYDTCGITAVSYTHLLPESPNLRKIRSSTKAIRAM